MAVCEKRAGNDETLENPPDFCVCCECVRETDFE